VKKKRRAGRAGNMRTGSPRPRPPRARRFIRGTPSRVASRKTFLERGGWRTERAAASRRPRSSASAIRPSSVRCGFRSEGQLVGTVDNAWMLLHAFQGGEPSPRSSPSPLEEHARAAVAGRRSAPAASSSADDAPAVHDGPTRSHSVFGLVEGSCVVQDGETVRFSAATRARMTSQRLRPGPCGRGRSWASSRKHDSRGRARARARFGRRAPGCWPSGELACACEFGLSPRGPTERQQPRARGLSSGTP